MRFVTVVKGVALVSLLSTGSLVPSICFADAAKGVKCPSGYTTTFSNNVMKCSKQVTPALETRVSVCPFGCGGLGGCKYNLVAGKDFCTQNSDGATVHTVPENTFDPQNYRLDTDGGNGTHDRFLKGGEPVTQFTYPNQL